MRRTSRVKTDAQKKVITGALEVINHFACLGGKDAAVQAAAACKLIEGAVEDMEVVLPDDPYLRRHKEGIDQ